MFETVEIKNILSSNSYPGRGIITGNSDCGRYAVCAYFIMGRSANSRNRVFKLENNELFTRPFDLDKVENPDLIIYRAMRAYDNNLIITNGDQTDTVYEGLSSGKSFVASLDSRTFEPDAPNFTPRISAMLTFKGGSFTYQMSVIKSMDISGTKPMRSYYKLEPLPGLGHFIHTYLKDGSPLPPFSGDPERIFIPSDIDEFSNTVWNSLDSENKISLYVRYTDTKSLSVTERIFNKNEGNNYEIV